MSVISDIVYKIRNAVYAKDVREAIASGIEQINDVAQSVRNDADGGKLTQTFVHKGIWKVGADYVANSKYIDLVQYDGSTYVALKSHFSSENIRPENTAYWALFARKGEAVLEDTGWIRVSVGNTEYSQVAPYGEDTWPEVRKIGKIVRMRGIVTPLDNFANSTRLIVTSVLPEEYRPSKNTVSVQQGSMSYKFVLIISSDGRIIIEKYSNDTNSEHAIPVNSWLSCDSQWFAD